MAILLLQARTNSSRLPAKVLLPIEGVPLVVLAAQRAANTGHRVVVVTSHEKTDDALCIILQNWNIEYFRGDLENPLKRFVDALKLVADEQVVVRLTGDNVVPDGAFIDELLEDFKNRKLDYLCCGDEACGLPHGISVEITLAVHLRAACNQAETSFDREHVTPKIIKNYGRTLFKAYGHLAMHQYRCTVDTLDDYLLICRLFSGFDKPEKVPLDTLLTRLKSILPQAVSWKSGARMVLGAAQFGMNYGITNKNGKPDQKQVNTIVQTAISNGVQYIDTARSYGDSEQLLGEALSGGWDSRVTVISKLSSLEDCPEDSSKSVVKAYVERSVFKSCNALRMKSLGVLMLHRAQHLTAWKGAVWETLCDLKRQGVISKLGVSLQSPEEALLALNIEDIEVIQLPFNILDYRWDTVIKKISQTRDRRRLVVHARSTLLQGLLTSSQIDLWQSVHCTNPTEVTDWLRNKAAAYTNSDIVGLALRYVNSQNWIDGVVIGVETKEQLIHNLIELSADGWTSDVVYKLISDRPWVPAQTLNPVKWK